MLRRPAEWFVNIHIATPVLRYSNDLQEVMRQKHATLLLSDPLGR
jgi:hypothetical protein